MKSLSSTSYTYRLDQMGNPLQVPLPAGLADVYVDGEYILSSTIATFVDSELVDGNRRE